MRPLHTFRASIVRMQQHFTRALPPKRSVGLHLQLAIIASALVIPSLASAQDMPTVISPLSVEPDINGVNLVDGHITIDIPVLSIPAAPRLKYDRTQNAAPFVTAKINSNTDTNGFNSGSYSVHTADGTSESFHCVDHECYSITRSGSTLGGGSSYRRAGSGELYALNVLSSYSVNQLTGVTSRVAFASRITYPDGEIISYTYETGYISGNTSLKLLRPITISTNKGYHISLEYEAGDPGTNGWNTVSQATIYKDSDPTTPLARFTYGDDGSITDLKGRVYYISGVVNSLGGYVESTHGTIQLPGEAQNSLTISRNPNFDMISSVVRDGVQWSYTYDNPVFANWLPGGYQYDKVTVTGPDQYNVSYDITPVGLGNQATVNVITGMTDSLQRHTSFGYDSTNVRVNKITYPEGNSVEVTYDIWGNITLKTTHAKPNLGSDLVEQAYVDTTNCTDVLCYRPTWYKDALGRQTDFEYNSHGQLKQQTDPADANGVRKRTIYDYEDDDTGNGLISRLSAKHVCAYDAANPSLNTCGTTAEFLTEYTYWGHTTLPATVSEVDQINNQTLVTTYSYDSAGRVLSIDGTLPGTDDAQYFRYDVIGRKTWEIGQKEANNLRSAKQYTYRDSDNKVTKVEIGTVASPTSSTLTVNQTIDTSYDSRRYPVRTSTSASGSTYAVLDKSFDDRGRMVCSTVRMNKAAFGSLPTDACTLGTEGSDGPDRITETFYDKAGQVTQIRKAVHTSLEQAYVTYDYTLNGKRKYVIDANGNRAEMVYDGYDRQSKWIFPSATAPSNYNPSDQAAALLAAGAVNPGDYEQYGYDFVGNRTSLRKRDGSTISYFYDNTNKLIQKSVPNPANGPNASATGNCYTLTSDSNDVCYGYDVRGLQVFARFGNASGQGVSSAYDAFGRLASQTSTMGGNTRTLSYQYDDAGNRTRLTFPDNQYFTYGYDTAGNMTGIIENGTTQVVSIGYDTQGRRSSLGGGITSSYGYDPIGRLASLTHDLAGTSLDVTYGFPTYNTASQLISRTRSNDSYGWHNYTDHSLAYTSNGLNQYSTVAGASYAYDANGNLTSADGTTYTYDRENRMLSASGTFVGTMVYDPNGRLFQTSGGSAGTTQFLYDGDALVAEYTSSGALVRRYVHGPGVDEPLLWYEGSGVSSTNRRVLRADHQGSIVAVTDANGNSIATDTYDEYGVPDDSTNLPTKGRFRYTGQILIPEVGLYYYKARMYSPKLGRFMQTDPIGYKDQINLYAYAGNDPVNLRDPTGETCEVAGNGKAITCTVKYDKKISNMSSKERTAANKVVTNYTRAAALAYVAAERGMSVSVDGFGGEKGFSVPASQIRDQLFSSDVNYKFSLGKNSYFKMENNNNAAHAFQGINVAHGAVANMGNTEMQRTFLHEGIHNTPAERVASGSRWNYTDPRMYWGHTAPFNRAVGPILNIHGSGGGVHTSWPSYWGSEMNGTEDF